MWNLRMIEWCNCTFILDNHAYFVKEETVLSCHEQEGGIPRLCHSVSIAIYIVVIKVVEILHLAQSHFFCFLIYDSKVRRCPEYL